MAERIKVIFSKYDTDGNGTMDKEELGNLLRTLNPEFTVAQCDALFESIDIDNDGTIQYSEWVDWLSTTEGAGSGVKSGVMLAKDKSEMASNSTVDSTKRNKLRGKFAQLDKDGNGNLDFHEVYDFLQRRYPNMTMPDLKILYNCADKSNDGALDFYELLDMLVSLPAQKRAPGEKPAPKADLRESLMMRPDDDKMMAEAWARYEKDHQAVVSLTAELCSEIDSLKDETAKHKKFRASHAKLMKDHYAKTGQLK